MIKDQFRICQEKSKRGKRKVIYTYKDAHIFGASIILRQRNRSCLQDARDGQFDIELAEPLDRVSRNQADVATFYGHSKFIGVPIITPAEGRISKLHVGLTGMMNALFIKNLAARTQSLHSRSCRRMQVRRRALLSLQGRQAI